MSPSLARLNWKALALAGLLGGTALGVEVPPAISWTKLPNLPSHQSAAGAAVLNGEVWMAGEAPGGYPYATNKVQIFNPTTGWRTGPSMPTARYWPGAKVLSNSGQNEFYVVGGYSGYQGLNKVEKYSPSTGSWSDNPTDLSQTRGHAIMTAVVDNRLYAMGGLDNSGVYKTNEVYNPTTNTWSTLAPIPVATERAMTAVIGSKIYLFGGATIGATLNTSRAYDPVTDSWSQLPDMPRARALGAAFAFGNFIYLIGGTADGSDVIDVFDASTNSWSATTFHYPGSNTFNPVYAQTTGEAYMLGDSYGYGYPGVMDAWVGQVPEPTTLLLLPAGAMLMLRRKRSV